MKLIISLYLATLVSCLSISGQELISIVGESPYPGQTKVFFEGYEGFQKTDLGSVRATDASSIDFFTGYHGYCIMSAEGSDSYPLILVHDPTCLEWDSIPVFPCESENKFLYEMIPHIINIEELIAAYHDNRDSLAGVNLMNRIDSSLTICRQKLSSTDALQAAVLIRGRLLMLESGLVHKTNEMADLKAEIAGFLKENFKILFHSDLLIGLAEAYTGMNAKVFSTELSAGQACVVDVAEWLSILGTDMPERDIMDYFLLYFAGQGEHEVLAQILEENAGRYECEQYAGSNRRPHNMPYTFSIFGGQDLDREYSLEQFTGISKVLALYSGDCPASAASIVALYGFMTRNEVRMPVILVPNDEAGPEIAGILSNHAPFGMQTGIKLGGALMIGAGITQLPAFIVLDERNLLSDVFYSFDEIKNYLSK